MSCYFLLFYSNYLTIVNVKSPVVNNTRRLAKQSVSLFRISKVLFIVIINIGVLGDGVKNMSFWIHFRRQKRRNFDQKSLPKMSCLLSSNVERFFVDIDSILGPQNHPKMVNFRKNGGSKASSEAVSR